jgi:hypothetical protein
VPSTAGKNFETGLSTVDLGGGGAPGGGVEAQPAIAPKVAVAATRKTRERTKGAIRPLGCAVPRGDSATQGLGAGAGGGGGAAD